ncbi:hypothetical protein [Mesorhizobium shangrilense]|uniref:Uncharacterized protein n=1 Tax=Mesorhizobium shangrilense TaxID=460060 RepID=A0ABV2DR07_9HYPH
MDPIVYRGYRHFLALGGSVFRLINLGCGRQSYAGSICPKLLVSEAAQECRKSDEGVARAGPSVWTSAATQTVREFGTQLASMICHVRNASRRRVVVDQSLEFGVCKLAAVLYGLEDDVDTPLFGSQLPI